MGLFSFIDDIFGGGDPPPPQPVNQAATTEVNNTTNVAVSVSPSIPITNVIDLTPLERAFAALAKVEETGRRELTDAVERQNPLLKALGESLAVGAVVDAAAVEKEAEDRAKDRKLQQLGLFLTGAAVLVGLMGARA